MKRVKSMILAAGLGTRLRPLTERMPKCLVPVAGRPILDYWMDALGDIGVRDILVNTHTFPEQMRMYIARQNSNGCRRIVEAHEQTLFGSAGTIAHNPCFADDADEIIIIYADNLSDVDLGSMLTYHRSHDDPFTMLLFKTAHPRSCGIVELDNKGRVISFAEKPDNPRSNLANAGVYIMDAKVYRDIAAMNLIDIGFDVLPRYIGRMRGWIWTGYHQDIGTLEAYEQAQDDAQSLLASRGIDAVGVQPAVFLDRDGTLIEHVHYLSDPSLVRLLPGVGDALRQLRAAGFKCIVVSNQSALGRGLIDEALLCEINDAMCNMLAQEGAMIDAIYICPIVPGQCDRAVVEHPDRKPGAGMLLRAAEEHRLDVGRSWMIGDMISDVIAGYNAGCRGSILIGGQEEHDATSIAESVYFEHADDLLGAVNIICNDAAPLRGSGWMVKDRGVGEMSQQDDRS